MKKVICLYRVSTVGQVDHDDIPMQRMACREYAKTHSDWEIIDEICEKGVSGYKISTNQRDAIVEIKKRAVQHQFDVLLVFMFDRLGRREDETPFVVQWFVQQGIEVWSTREGEQRFDTHVDKLLNYIRFWQASGESEKTAIRVRTKHEQMVMNGQWRGGLVPYGYKLEYLGRTNKRNKPVRDLVIDEQESQVVKEIFRLITAEGYGTNRVAAFLNSQGVKTKRGTTLWRGTSIRVLISNPIYKGVMHFGDAFSQPFENLRIISDELFDRCEEIVKGRVPEKKDKPVDPMPQGSQNLLTGLIYCGHCGNRLCYSHNTTHRKLASGIEKVYERNLYRCYRRISSPQSCGGPSGYDIRPINNAVENAVREFLERVSIIPRSDLIAMAESREATVAEVAYEQATKEFNEAQRQVNALEEEALNALTGKNKLDLSIVNSMLLKQKAILESAARRMEENKAQIEAEEQIRKANEFQVDELLSWAERFDGASKEAKHQVIGQLVERVVVKKGYKIDIHFRMTAEQFLGKMKEKAASA